LELLGRAHVGRLAVVGAGRVVVEGPVGVVGDVKVGVTVAVEVGEAGAAAPALGREAGLLRDVNELAPLGGVPGIDRLIVPERQPAPAGDEDVRPAVAVVVAHGGAVAVEPRTIETDFLRHVLELEAAEVLVELAGVALDRLPLVETAAREENIKQAIAVV